MTASSWSWSFKGARACPVRLADGGDPAQLCDVPGLADASKCPVADEPSPQRDGPLVVPPAPPPPLDPSCAAAHLDLGQLRQLAV